MGSVLPWSGKAVVPHFVSDIELMVRGLLRGRSRLSNLTRFIVVGQRRKSFSGADVTLPGTGEWYRL